MQLLLTGNSVVWQRCALHWVPSSNLPLLLLFSHVLVPICTVNCIFSVYIITCKVNLNGSDYFTAFYHKNSIYSRVIHRPTLRPNFKGKLKFTCSISIHTFTVPQSDCKRVLNFISHSLITAQPRPQWLMVVAVAIDARHCRWEMCRCKYFRFHQKYCPCLQRIGIQSHHWCCRLWET